MEMDKIREAILNKAREDAARITEEAKRKAQRRIEEAKKRREFELEDMRKKMLSSVHREESRILAKASMEAQQQLLREKAGIVNHVLEQVKHELRNYQFDKESLIRLVIETLEAFEPGSKVKIFVTSKDLKVAQETLREDSNLKKRIEDIGEIDCLGGLSAEDERGMVKVDNTFETRLESLMAKRLPRIGEELFGVDE